MEVSSTNRQSALRGIGLLFLAGVLPWPVPVLAEQHGVLRIGVLAHRVSPDTVNCTGAGDTILSKHTFYATITHRPAAGA
jgi:hypothetical protein